MKVLKFGGTSVGSTESIKLVGAILKQYHDSKVPVIVVVSAMKGITNSLLDIGLCAIAGDLDQVNKGIIDIQARHFTVVKNLLPIKEQSKVLAHIKRLMNDLEEIIHGVFLLKELSPRSKDLILSFGERLSAYVIHNYILQQNIPSEYVDSRELIRTDDQFGSAAVNFAATNKNIVEHFKNEQRIPVVTGFIAANDSGQTTTLGRGGSDYTAAILAAALGAEEIEIWTDVDGVMTADPNMVSRAFSLSALSYVEAMELTHFGAKVIYPPTLQPAFARSIPLRIRNTFNTDFEGTIISKTAQSTDMPIKGISSIQDVALVNVQGSGMVGVPGIASRLFGALGRVGVNIILITQASSEHSICFAISPDQTGRARNILESEFSFELSTGLLDPVIIEDRQSIVAIIGENMRRTPGIADKLFGALGKNGINVVAIAQGSSELNVSVVIDQYNLPKALKVLHGAFFLSNRRLLNLFMIGTGLIGRTLLQQLSKQFEFFYNQRLLEIRLIGVANTSRMLVDVNGLSIANWKETLMEKGEKTDLIEFVDRMKKLNLPNSVFVDNTAGSEVPDVYQQILEASISIVTPNKVANSQSMQKYRTLHKTALNKQVKYLYETNVGAGLPVIKSLNELVLSGDQITSIEGVLSGTISYIFNSFNGTRQFSEIVREAQQKGYTEPDPRDDLNGKDVARKILILARVVGLSLELEDVKIEPLLAPECFDADSVEEFFEILEAQDTIMEARIREANKKGKVLRYIAKLEGGKATVNLVPVGSDHLFYSLSGSDNIIAFSSDRYQEKPLLIRGPGAGAEVTAAGVFADLIEVSDFLVG